MPEKEPEFKKGDIVVHKGTGNEAVVLWPRFYCSDPTCKWYDQYMTNETGNCDHDLVFDETYRVETDFGEICNTNEVSVYKKR